MSQLVMWNLLVGFLMPNVIAVLEQPRFSDPVRASIMAVVCIIGGGATAYFNDDFNTQDVVGSILTVGVAAVSFYKSFWRPLGVAPAIENKTSPANQRAA